MTEIDLLMADMYTNLVTQVFARIKSIPDFTDFFFGISSIFALQFSTLAGAPPRCLYTSYFVYCISYLIYAWRLDANMMLD